MTTSNTPPSLTQRQRNLLDAYHADMLSGNWPGSALEWMNKHHVTSVELGHLYVLRYAEVGTMKLKEPESREFPASREELLQLPEPE